jgi:general secretion pathway protein J
MTAHNRGFTLVEMLVAMAIFSLLAVAASSLLGVSLRNADTFDKADAATRELQIARTIMRADFSQIARRSVREAYGAPVPAMFTGGSAAPDKPIVAFVRHGWDNPGGADARASLQYVEYAVTDGALVRRSRPYLDPTPETPVTTAKLLSGVGAAGMSFLSRGQWSDRWLAAPPQNSLPDAVAVDITLGAGVIRQAFLVGEQ